MIFIIHPTAKPRLRRVENQKKLCYNKKNIDFFWSIAMNHIQRGILTLIRSALTGKSLPLPEAFALADAEALIVKHQITGLAYEGAVLCGIPKDDPAMARLFQRYYQLSIRSNIQAAALQKVYDAFEENGIDYLPVKGCVLKALYPKPAMRTMGDADVLIRMEQYDAIKALMPQLGYTEDPPYYHELPWSCKALHLELHKSLIPEFHTIEYNFFANTWDRAVHTGGCRWDQSPEDAFLFIFAHYAKHYRGGGIGIRQLVDIWVWHNAYPAIDMAVVQAGLEKLQFWDFYNNTMQMLHCWFADDPVTDRAAFMTDYIFSSGSWGTTQQHNASRALRNTKIAGSSGGGRRLLFLNTIFPSLRVMKVLYPVLKRSPWLLPFLWPVRWFSILFFHQDRIRRFRRTMADSSDEKIESFEQAMHYVGLTVYKGGKIT